MKIIKPRQNANLECNSDHENKCLYHGSQHTLVFCLKCSNLYFNIYVLFIEVFASKWQFLLKPHIKICRITKVTQNNTGMYTEESSQQTFKMDGSFERTYQNHHAQNIRYNRPEIIFYMITWRVHYDSNHAMMPTTQ